MYLEGEIDEIIEKMKERKKNVLVDEISWISKTNSRQFLCQVNFLCYYH